MEKELLAAEIYLAPVDTGEATAEIDREMDVLEKKIQDFTVNLSLEEYGVAIASGIFSGIIDATVTGETELFDSVKPENLKEQVKSILQKVFAVLKEKSAAKKHAFFPAMKAEEMVNLPFLKDLAESQGPFGLLASVALQLGFTGILHVKQGESPSLFPESQKIFKDMSTNDKIFLFLATVIVGILKWLADTSAEGSDSGSERSFQTMGKLRTLIRNSPAFAAMTKRLDKWVRQLPRELSSLKKEFGEPFYAEQAFFAFFLMLADIPEFAGNRLKQVMSTIRIGKEYGLDQVPIIHALSRQAFPVLVNEVIVRTFFFAYRLAGALSGKESLEGICWERVLPFENKDIQRMTAVSAMTLSIVDIADAAVHGYVDANLGAFCVSKFLACFNLVAEGRTAVAVYQEYQDEKTRQALYEERVRLTRLKTEKVVAALDQYQQELQERLSGYLTERIETFLAGIETMDQGLNSGNSELVIRGNVMIQRVLGRELQFTSQQEFDDLMDSDIALKL